jgi:hypothetical protein
MKVDSDPVSGDGLATQCTLCNIRYMARGDSGRIVLEVDPDLKGELYVELAKRGLTLRAWFIGEAERLVDPKRRTRVKEPPAPKYGVKRSAARRRSHG